MDARPIGVGVSGAVRRHVSGQDRWLSLREALVVDAHRPMAYEGMAARAAARDQGDEIQKRNRQRTAGGRRQGTSGKRVVVFGLRTCKAAGRAELPFRGFLRSSRRPEPARMVPGNRRLGTATSRIPPALPPPRNAESPPSLRTELWRTGRSRQLTPALCFGVMGERDFPPARPQGTIECPIYSVVVCQQRPLVRIQSPRPLKTRGYGNRP